MNWYLSLPELDYVSHIDFLRMGMTEEINLKLGPSTQTVTQMILHVGWLRVTESYYISSNTNDKYVSHLSNLMRVRKISWHKSSRVVVVCQKIWTYDQLDLTAARKSELAKNHGMDRWTSGQKMCFLTTNISSITQPIQLKLIPFERLDWIIYSYFKPSTIY